MNIKKQLWEKYNAKNNEELARALVVGINYCDFCVYEEMQERENKCAGYSCEKGVEKYIEERWENDCKGRNLENN